MKFAEFGAGSATVLVAAMALHVGSTAAQTTANEATPVEGEFQLEQVIVTAQRREETMQRIPLSVSAIDAETLTASGIGDTQSIMTAVPGLSWGKQATGVTPFLRGVGTNSGQIGAESTVGIYIDGVYLPSASGAVFSLNSIDRVEVLKGPQGTLFGRNASGGVIQLITRDPKSAPSAELKLAYGNYATSEGSFYGTSGFGDSLAGDVSIYARDQSDGYGRSLTSGDDAFTARDFAIRNKWLWTVSDLTNVRLTLDYNRMGTEQGVGFAVAPGSLGLDGQSRFAGKYNTYAPDDYIDTWQYGAALRVEHSLPWADLVSITSARKYNTELIMDQDATPLAVSRVINTQTEHDFTQELQLVSNEDSDLTWIVGAFFFDDTAANDPQQVYGSAAGGPPYTQGNAELKTRSYAAYAQATKEILPKTRLTLGVRYTQDDKDISGVRSNPIQGVVLTSAQSASYDKVTYRMAVDYQFTPDVMAYASYNRGYKSGGWDMTAFFLPPVNPEVVDSYELGAKTEMFDNRLRLNFAGFYYDYQDFQLGQVIPGAIQLVNAAQSTIKGLELEFDSVPFERFRLNGGLSYIHGRYDSFPRAPLTTPRPTGGNVVSTFDAAGLETIRTPKVSGSIAATYSIPASSGDVDASVSYAFNNGFYWDFAQRLRQPVTHIVTASLAWNTADDKWGMSLWGRNLLNEFYYSYGSTGGLGDIVSPGLPRTYGISVTRRFGQ